MNEEPQKARVLTKEELKSLSTKSNRIFLDLALTYSVFAGVLATLSYLQSQPLSLIVILTYATAYVAIGWVQLCLLNANHDGLHYHFGTQHHDLFMGFLTGYPIGITLGFRDVHWNHHRHFGHPQLDPDYGNFGRFPKSRVEFVLRILKNLSGYVALLQLSGGSASGSAKGGKFPVAELAKLAIAQLVLLGIFSLVTHPIFYVLFWGLPLITVGRMGSFLRTFCEHGSPEKDYTLRTFIGPKHKTMTLGMYNFNYHAEHHLYPNIPYPHLPETNRLITNRLGEQQDLYEIYHGGYLDLLLEWYRSLPLVYKDVQPNG